MPGVGARVHPTLRGVCRDHRFGSWCQVWGAGRQVILLHRPEVVLVDVLRYLDCDANGVEARAEKTGITDCVRPGDVN